jgi:hypothetical protein
MSSPGAWCPGQIWSWWDMLSVRADRLVLTVRELSKMTQVIAASDAEQNGVKLAKRHFFGLKKIVSDYLADCEQMGLRVCLASARRLLEVLERVEQKNALPPERVNIDISLIDVFPLNRYMEEIINRTPDELGSRLVLALRPESERYYQATEPLFGPDVDAKFPNAAYDIAEAGKCLALDRATATVFHLMRVMEVGVRASARCLGIPDPIKDADRNWGAVLRKISDERTRRSTQKPKVWNSDDEELFAEIYALLDAVRSVWRNPTMHIEQKYAPEEAELIYVATRSFIKKIASRADENGNPKA